MSPSSSIKETFNTSPSSFSHALLIENSSDTTAEPIQEGFGRVSEHIVRSTATECWTIMAPGDQMTSFQDASSFPICREMERLEISGNFDKVAKIVYVGAIVVRTAMGEPYAVQLLRSIRAATDIEKHGQQIGALRYLLSRFDSALKDGRFSACDEMLTILSCETLSTNLLLGILSATLPAASRLPFRDQFVSTVRQQLANRGRDTAKLLRGLEKWRKIDGSTC